MNSKAPSANSFANHTSDGKVIGTWSRNENRVFVDYDSISPYVFQALVATEDVRSMNILASMSVPWGVPL